LLAATLLAVDGIVVAQDRRAMLEAPSNLFSMLAILCYVRLVGLRIASGSEGSNVARYPELPLVAVGLLAALALLTKGTSVALVAAIAIDLLVRRRWRELRWFALSLVAFYLLLALPFLLFCPAEYIRQNYVFHLLRPYGGTVLPLERLTEIWNYAWTWSTVRFALAGLAVTLLIGRQARNREAWGVVCTWAVLVLVLLLSSRTYWATYFSQLAVPLSLLGGLLLNTEVNIERLSLVRRLPWLGHQRWFLMPVALLTAIVIVGYPSLRRQFVATRAALQQTKPAYASISEYVMTHLPAGAPVLAFETNHTFLSSHPPACRDDGTFFVDSYGQMLYVNLGIPALGLGDSISMWLNQGRSGSQAIFHREPAQLEVRQIFDRARYVIVDSRAAKQLTEATSAYLLQRSEVLHSAFGSELRARTGER
jgi:hypothetical protein